MNNYNNINTDQQVSINSNQILDILRNDNKYQQKSINISTYQHKATNINKKQQISRNETVQNNPKLQ